MMVGLTVSVTAALLLLLLSVVAAARSNSGNRKFGVPVSSPFLYRLCYPAAGLDTILTSLRGGGGDGVQRIISVSQMQGILDTAARNNDPQLVVLDFTSNSCPPCEMMAPIYTDLSQMEEFRNVVFCKINVSEHPKVGARYGVDGWPTFLLFKDGVVIDRLVGGQAAKAGLYALVAKHA